MKYNTNRKRFHILLTVVIMTFIFIQSALPADLSEEESGLVVRAIVGLLDTDADRTSFVVRKCAHFAEYLCLGVSLLWTARDVLRDMQQGLVEDIQHNRVEDTRSVVRSSVARSGGGPSMVLPVLPPWVIGTIYALTDELHQSFVPGRSCELRDVFIDSAGVAAGVLIAAMIGKRKDIE